MSPRFSVARSLPDRRRNTSNTSCPREHWRSEAPTTLSTGMPSPIDAIPMSIVRRPLASDSGRRIRAHAQRHSGRAWPNRPNGPIGGGPAGDSVVRVSEREQPCEHDVICDANVRRGRRSWWRVVGRHLVRRSPRRPERIAWCGGDAVLHPWTPADCGASGIPRRFSFVITGPSETGLRFSPSEPGVQRVVPLTPESSGG